MALIPNPNYNPATPGSQPYKLSADSVINTVTGQLAGGNMSSLDGYKNPNINSVTTAPNPVITLPTQKPDNTNYGAVIEGGTAQIKEGSKTGSTPTDTADPTTKLFQDFLKSQEPAPSQATAYEQFTGKTASAIAAEQQMAELDARNKRAMVKAAQAELAGIQAELQAVSDKRDQSNLQLEKESENRGIVGTILSRQQQEISRRAAIDALPLQAKALAKQAQIQGLQGEAEYAQSTLKSAQDKLDNLFRLQQTDAQNQYEYRKEQRESVYKFYTEAEKIKSDALQKKDANDLILQRDNRQDATELAKVATASFQSDLASEILALDPALPTFRQSLAALSGRVVVPVKKEIVEPLSNFVDIMQQNIDAGLSPEIAAREAAAYSEQTLGVPVNSDTLSLWTKQARALKKNVTNVPVDVPAEVPQKGFLNSIKDMFKTTPPATSQPTKSLLPDLSGYKPVEASTIGNFFSNLFGS